MGRSLLLLNVLLAFFELNCIVLASDEIASSGDKIAGNNLELAVRVVRFQVDYPVAELKVHFEINSFFLFYLYTPKQLF